MKVLITSCILIVVLFFTAVFPVQAIYSLLVYEPYTIGADVAGLINTAQNYFEDRGVDFDFQPVTDFEQFQRHLDGTEYVVMPAWAYHTLESEYFFQPLLTARVEESSSTTWKLVAPDGAAPYVESLPEMELAMMRFGSETEQILEDILLPDSVAGRSLNIIDVSKPLDALMAVKFGQVEAAIINSTSFNLIEMEQPNLVEGLEVVRESEPLIQTTLFASSRGEHGEIEELFSEMENHTTGQQLLKQLNFEGWEVNRGFEN